jgi:hypothetical protein
MPYEFSYNELKSHFENRVKHHQQESEAWKKTAALAGSIDSHYLAVYMNELNHHEAKAAEFHIKATHLSPDGKIILSDNDLKDLELYPLSPLLKQ